MKKKTLSEKLVTLKDEEDKLNSDIKKLKRSRICC